MKKGMIIGIAIALVIVVLLILGGTGVFDITGRAVGINNGLVAYYMLEGFTNVDNVVDNSNNGHVAICDIGEQTCPEVTNGIDNNGLEFDGINDYLNIGTDEGLDVFGAEQDFSIFTWIRRDSLRGAGGIIGVGKFQIAGITFDITSDDKLAFEPPESPTYQSTGVISDTNWHIVGLTADRDGDLIIYIDGEVDSVHDISSRVNEDWNRNSDIDHYKIGNSRHSSNFFNGAIDDFRLYDRALSEEEASSL